MRATDAMPSDISVRDAAGMSRRDAMMLLMAAGSATSLAQLLQPAPAQAFSTPPSGYRSQVRDLCAKGG